MKTEGRAEGQHPLNSKCPNMAVRKGEPSLGSGSPSITAFGLPLGTDEERNGMTHTKNRRNSLAFEQQAKESERAFSAFSLYLSLGPERSLVVVARKLAKSHTLIARWSAKFDWPARVAAHAAHLATVEREATEALARGKAAGWLTRQVEHREEEWKVRGEALETAREALRRWRSRPDRCGSLEGIARLLELASKLGRLASGLATETVEHTGEDGGPIRVEFEAALRKVYGPVVDVEVVPVPPKAIKEGA
jgi:hypothetical protein